MKTVIFSTHIMQEVQATSDRVLIIDQGKIAAQGTTEELKASIAGQQQINLVLRAAKKQDVLKAFQDLENASLEDLLEGPGGDLTANVIVDAGVDMREQIFDLAVTNKWKVLEAAPTAFSLEDVFRKLTN